MVLLFVVCGWREEAVAGVFLRTYLVHSTYVFLCTKATKVGKIVNPAVGLLYVSYHSAFVIGDGFLKSRSYKTIILPSRYAGGPIIFLRHRLREGNREDFSLREFCLSYYATPQASSEKRVQAPNTDDATLSTSTVEYEFHPLAR
jgi:hypothetical protein